MSRLWQYQEELLPNHCCCSIVFEKLVFKLSYDDNIGYINIIMSSVNKTNISYVNGQKRLTKK